MLTFNFRQFDFKNESGVMLDIGCGEGRHVFGAMQNYKNFYCIGLDMYEPSLAKAQEGFEFFKSISNEGAIFIKGSAYELPFPSDSIDLIICSEVLEHLNNYSEALSEIYRVLKPHGKFLASVPSFFPEKICWMLSKDYQNMPGGHVRIFKKKAIINEIEQLGFLLKKHERFHSIHSPYWWLRCLFWKNQDNNWLIGVYKKLLEKHILEKPYLIDLIDRLFNPILGKSLSMYFEKR